MRTGYLFVEGRADDTIIRGGENIAPAEIEDVLVSHDGIVDAVVVGMPDDAVGPAAGGRGRGRARSRRRPPRSSATWCATRLRSSKTPEVIEFWPELPRTDTGKLLRRTVVARLTDA